MPFINCLSNFNDLIGGPPRVCPKIFSTATFSQVSSIPEMAPINPQPKDPKLVSDWDQKILKFIPSAKHAEVLDTGAKYLILCCNRQWGKTTTISIKALHAALHTPNLSIVVISRSKEQAGFIIESATHFALNLGLKTRRVPNRSFSLLLPNQSRICAVPHTQDTSLGRTADILIVDEAATVKDEVYFSVASFVARTHGKIWMLSTPTRQSGFFYNYWHDKSTDWHRVLSTVDDCPEIDRQFLELFRRADPIRYQQDFLCLFVQPANRLCNREFVRSILRKKGTRK